MYTPELVESNTENQTVPSKKQKVRDFHTHRWLWLMARRQEGKDREVPFDPCNLLISSSGNTVAVLILGPGEVADLMYFWVENKTGALLVWENSWLGKGYSIGSSKEDEGRHGAVRLVCLQEHRVAHITLTITLTVFTGVPVIHLF